jgi:O-antigen ligase
LGVGRTVGGTIQLRPWSTFPSNSEYSAFVGIAVVFATAMLYHRRPLLALALPVLVLAVFLAGGRSVMALTLLTAMVLTALRTRNRVLALAVVVLGIGLTYGAALTFGDQIDKSANLSGDPNAAHQTGGLLNPLDPSKSTFIGHLDAVQRGVETGFTHPVGLGTGASNLGAQSVGQGNLSSDNDIGNVFVSLGIIGGLAFVAFIVMGFRTVFSRYLRGPPDPLLLAVAGVMVLTFGYWLNGGHYANSALLMFLLGWAVRPSGRPDAEAPNDASAAR